MMVYIANEAYLLKYPSCLAYQPERDCVYQRLYDRRRERVNEPYLLSSFSKGRALIDLITHPKYLKRPEGFTTHIPRQCGICHDYVATKGYFFLCIQWYPTLPFSPERDPVVMRELPLYIENLQVSLPTRSLGGCQNIQYLNFTQLCILLRSEGRFMSEHIAAASSANSTWRTRETIKGATTQHLRGTPHLGKHGRDIPDRRFRSP